MFDTLPTAESLMGYQVFAVLVLVPLMMMFKRAGFPAVLGLLVFTPYAGLFICLGYLGLKRWPNEPSPANSKTGKS
jgi:hypothetical protein